MITGLNIKEIPFKNVKFIGVLLFKEYPSTVIYSDEKGIPLILEWVDFVEENNFDRYFIYESNPSSLKNYIEKRTTHLDLIHESNNGVAVFFDNSLDEPKNISIISTENISSEYLPSPYNYFDADDSEDLSLIVDFFQLNKIKVDQKVEPILITDVVKKLQTELFHIHLNNGQHISHGRAQTDVLGNTLISFEELYHEVASDFVRGKDRIKKITKQKDKVEFNRIAHTEVVLSKAASYSIYLRPISGQVQFNVYDELGNSPLISSGEKIFHDVIELVNLATSEENIKPIVDKYNHNVFVKLKLFAENIKKNDLDLDLEYYSPVSENLWEKKNMDVNLANTILMTLSKTSVTHDDKFDAKGKFTALNCNTGHFTFITLEEEEYTGYFDKLIRESMPTLNFVDIFSVTVERSEVKNIADADFKFTDKILAVFSLKQ